MVTVDAVVLVGNDPDFHVALIKRGKEPFAGSWALPGGFVEMDETLDAAAARELEEETGLTSLELKQFYAFGNPGRDPRGRSISIAYYGFIPALTPLCAADDAVEAAWFPTGHLPPLAFDHGEIIARAIEKIKG